MRVLTVRNPWALAIFMGKDIENRNWPTSMRGTVAIHASAGMGKAEYADSALWIERCGGIVPPTFEDCMAVCGCVLGTVEITDCVHGHSSPWFQGPYGFVLANQQRFKTPLPAKGKLGFWLMPPAAPTEGGPRA
jgi:hypothetical protein